MYSKETENLKLPQWQPKDHPDFLTDMNEAYQKIDNFAGSMGFISEPMFNEVVQKQNKLADDMVNLQNDLSIVDNEVHSIESKLPVLEDWIQHEHEKNDEQDTQIRNLQQDIHTESIARENNNKQLQNNIDAETERAQTTEALIQQNINDEVSRAVAVETEMKTAIDNLNTSTDELNAKVAKVETSIRNEHERNDQQEIAITNIENSINELDADVEQLHEDILKEIQDREEGDSVLQTSVENLSTRVTALEENNENYLTETKADEKYTLKDFFDETISEIDNSITQEHNANAQQADAILTLQTKVTALEDSGYLPETEADEKYVSNENFNSVITNISNSIAQEHSTNTDQASAIINLNGQVSNLINNSDAQVIVNANVNNFLKNIIPIYLNFTALALDGFEVHYFYKSAGAYTGAIASIETIQDYDILTQLGSSDFPYLGNVFITAVLTIPESVLNYTDNFNYYLIPNQIIIDGCSCEVNIQSVNNGISYPINYILPSDIVNGVYKIKCTISITRIDPTKAHAVFYPGYNYPIVVLRTVK